eukprot:gene2058-4020_t
MLAIAFASLLVHSPSLGDKFVRKKSTIQDPDAIAIAYTVDNTSAKLFALSIFSVAHTVMNVNKIHFRVIVCGPSLEESYKTRVMLRDFISSCLPHVNIKFICFSHPEDSPLKLSHRTHAGSPHWYGDTETVRLLIPQILPYVKKFIYFDNDIIITKKGIIEKLWQLSTEPPVNTALHMVLDILKPVESKHLVKTYFNYTDPIFNQLFPNNSSHNLQNNNDNNINNNNINSNNNSEILEKSIKIFKSHVHGFPNNGVMLVYGKPWRKLRLSQKFLSLAEANDQAGKLGYKLLAWGSQPFTVALLHSVWKGLPQEMNLRNAGALSARRKLDLNKGSGILHFAGVTKPNERCVVKNSTFCTPNLIAYVQLHFGSIVQFFGEKCPNSPMSFGLHCEGYISNLNNFCREHNRSLYPPWAQDVADNVVINAGYNKQQRVVVYGGRIFGPSDENDSKFRKLEKHLLCPKASRKFNSRKKLKKQSTSETTTATTASTTVTEILGTEESLSHAQTAIMS